MSAKDSENYLDSNFTVPDAMVFRYDDKDDHNYEQPRDFYRSLSPDWRERLHMNIAMSMKGVLPFIVERQLGELAKVDKNYAEGVRQEILKLSKKSENSNNNY